MLYTLPSPDCEGSMALNEECSIDSNCLVDKDITIISNMRDGAFSRLHYYYILKLCESHSMSIYNPGYSRIMLLSKLLMLKWKYEGTRGQL